MPYNSSLYLCLFSNKRTKVYKCTKKQTTETSAQKVYESIKKAAKTYQNLTKTDFEYEGEKRNTRVSRWSTSQVPAYRSPTLFALCKKNKLQSRIYHLSKKKYHVLGLPSLSPFGFYTVIQWKVGGKNEQDEKCILHNTKYIYTSPRLQKVQYNSKTMQ